MKKLAASLLMAAILTFPALAGDIHTGPVVNPTPPPPRASATIEEGDTDTDPLAAIVYFIVSTIADLY